MSRTLCARLEVVAGPAAGERTRLRLGEHGARRRLGTAAGCDLALRDSEVAPYHARLEQDADGVWLVDLGATAGIRWLMGGEVAVRALRLPAAAPALVGVGTSQLAIELGSDDDD